MRERIDYYYYYYYYYLLLLILGRYDVYESLVERKRRGRRKGDDKTVKFEVQANNDNGMNFDEEVNYLTTSNFIIIISPCPSLFLPPPSLSPLQILRVRFSSDLRVKEVKRLLASSEPVKISLEQKPEVRLVTILLYIIKHIILLLPLPFPPPPPPPLLLSVIMILLRNRKLIYCHCVKEQCHYQWEGMH